MPREPARRCYLEVQGNEGRRCVFDNIKPCKNSVHGKRQCPTAPPGISWTVAAPPFCRKCRTVMITIPPQF
eukprot:436140-Amphidinium_carterae.1